MVNSHSEKKSAAKSGVIWFLLAAVVIGAALWLLPGVLALSGISFLAESAALNKLLSVLLAVVGGVLALSPSTFFKDALALAKGARIEWRKTTKPEKSEVNRMTMIVLAIVAFSAFFIMFVDWIFFMIYSGFLG